MLASARYRPLLTWRLKSKSLGHTRKRTRVVASKSTLDPPIRLNPTANKRNQGNIEAVSFVGQLSAFHSIGQIETAPYFFVAIETYTQAAITSMATTVISDRMRIGGLLSLMRRVLRSGGHISHRRHGSMLSASQWAHFLAELV